MNSIHYTGFRRRRPDMRSGPKGHRLFLGVIPSHLFRGMTVYLPDFSPVLVGTGPIRVTRARTNGHRLFLGAITSHLCRVRTQSPTGSHVRTVVKESGVQLSRVSRLYHIVFCHVQEYGSVGLPQRVAVKQKA
jgi:hypothetical protein